MTAGAGRRGRSRTRDPAIGDTAKVEHFEGGDGGGAEGAPVGELVNLINAASREDLDESGIEHLSGSAMIVRSGRDVVAACGHRRWPNEVAHLSVLTHPQHRRVGHAETVARAAIQRAAAEGLLPQWRARVDASRQLAKKLGLTELGAQLGLRPG